MKSQTWTTGERPAADSFDHWQAVVSETLTAVTMQPSPGRGPFNAEITVSKLGMRSTIASFHSSAHRIVRTDRNLIDADTESVLLSLQLSGVAEVTQGKEEFLLGPCEVGLVDLRRPFSINFPHDVRRVVAIVPQLGLDIRSVSVGGRVSGPYGEMLGTHLLRMHEVAHLSEREASLLSCNIQNLLQLALHGGRESEFPVLPSRPTNRIAGKIAAYIDEHWTDPSLTANKAAQALGLSSRSVHAALQRIDTTFSELTLEKRLLESRARFSDASLIDRKICDLVYDCGFGDLSHFNRMFKQRFGDTPRQVRAKAVDSSSWN